MKTLKQFLESIKYNSDMGAMDYGTPAGTEYMKDVTPGQKDSKKLSVKKEETDAAETKSEYRDDNAKNAEVFYAYPLSKDDIAEIEYELDSMDEDDMEEYGFFDDDEDDDSDSIVNWDDFDIDDVDIVDKQGLDEDNPRIARKPGQPANSKKHSDLYTDENPKDTITGLKFATEADATASVTKIRNSGRSYAHKIQAAVAMEQRAKAAGKSEAAAVYRKYINANKKTDESTDLKKSLSIDSVDIQGLDEVLSIQGRMKRRFNARKNRQKLKVARGIALRRGAAPDRLKKRATRGARSMVYKRLLKGRDKSSMAPAEKARLEKLIGMYQPLIQRFAVRILPKMRKMELSRMKNRSGRKPQKAKKYKAASPIKSSSQKSSKFKVKK